jgi:hypothetical protein
VRKKTPGKQERAKHDDEQRMKLHDKSFHEKRTSTRKLSPTWYRRGKGGIVKGEVAGGGLGGLSILKVFLAA